MQSLVLLSDEQIDELSSAIKMKLGHKLKFAVTVKTAREDKEEQERKAREDKEEQERKRRREKEARKREEEEQEKEKEEQEEQKELERALSKIERKRILRDAEARADDHEHTDAKPKATEPTENTTATDPAQHQTAPLPAWKEFSAFISHKKMHTQFADSSETLSIRLKVHEMMDVCVGMYSHLKAFCALPGYAEMERYECVL